MPVARRPGQANTGRSDRATELRPCRVVVAEDDVLLREGLSSLLERSGLEIAARVGDALQLLEIVAAVPDLVIVASVGSGDAGRIPGSRSPRRRRLRRDG